MHEDELAAIKILIGNVTNIYRLTCNVEELLGLVYILKTFTTVYKPHIMFWVSDS